MNTIDIVKYKDIPGTFVDCIDRDSHIVMTTDVTAPRIFVIKEFAEKANVDAELTRIPVRYL